MKKILVPLFLGLVLLVPRITVHAQEVVPTQGESIADLRAEIIAMIKVLQAELDQMVAAQKAAPVSTQPTAPLFGNSSTPMQDQTLSIGDIATSSLYINDKVSKTVANIPIVIPGDLNYVEGIARLGKGDSIQWNDPGFSWQKGQSAVFQNTYPGTYVYSIKLYNRSYGQTHMGQDTDTVAETSGTFTVSE